MPKRLTTEWFIEKARLKHGDKYDYSLVVYINCDTKVCIICPIHGEFEQTPANHLHKTKPQGCPECGGSKKSTLEEFIIKARLKHGDKYDYSLVVYINNRTKIIIICPIHGEFEQTPSKHLYGYECKNCGVNNRVQKQTIYTYEICLEEAKKYTTKKEWREKSDGTYQKAYKKGWLEECSKHMERLGNDFKRCVYSCEFENINGLNYVYVGLTGNINNRHEQHKRKSSICEFLQIHNLELPKLKQLSEYIDKEQASKLEGEILNQYKNKGWTPINKTKTGGLGGGSTLKQRTEEFIEKARKIYGDKYDYSLVHYINTYTHITIICPIHGMFEQTPYRHLHKNGCKKCKNIK